MKTHKLKLDAKFFDDVKSGIKDFEIRKNDRDFEVGDILELRAWASPENEKYETWGKGCYLKFGTMDPSKPLFDFGQKFDDGVSDFFPVPNEEDADTVTVKVVDILTADVINDGLSIAIPEGSLSLSEFGTNKPLISALHIYKTLKEYFNTERLPDDYIVMAIEVVE